MSKRLRRSDHNTIRELAPNKRLQLTPLRGREIVAFLKRHLGLNDVPIYECGATEAQRVRSQTSNMVVHQRLDNNCL